MPLDQPAINLLLIKALISHHEPTNIQPSITSPGKDTTFGCFDAILATVIATDASVTLQAPLSPSKTQAGFLGALVTSWSCSHPFLMCPFSLSKLGGVYYAVSVLNDRGQIVSHQTSRCQHHGVYTVLRC